MAKWFVVQRGLHVRHQLLSAFGAVVMFAPWLVDVRVTIVAVSLLWALLISILMDWVEVTTAMDAEGTPL